ncbi:type II 3-dehydroquinate dehydratase [Microlunatus lacustris]
MTTVLVLNGPNLNLLGTREPAVYGSATLAEVEAGCRAVAAELGLELEFRQTNHEGELVDWLQEAGRRQADGEVVGVVLNPAAYSHTSVALADAISGTGLRLVEVHLSNVHRRESFRQHSYVSPVAVGVIVGLGPTGYQLAVRALAATGG